MKAIFLSIIALLSITISSCKKDDKDSEPVDQLQEIGILGTWEINSIWINNISSGAAECCEFVVFMKDDEPDDLHGLFRAYGAGYDKEGSFSLNVEMQQLITTDDDKDADTFTYSVSDNLMDLSYIDDGDQIIMGYIKRD